MYARTATAGNTNLTSNGTVMVNGKAVGTWFQPHSAAPGHVVGECYRALLDNGATLYARTAQGLATKVDRGAL